MLLTLNLVIYILLENDSVSLSLKHINLRLPIYFVRVLLYLLLKQNF